MALDTPYHLAGKQDTEQPWGRQWVQGGLQGQQPRLVFGSFSRAQATTPQLTSGRQGRGLAGRTSWSCLVSELASEGYMLGM